MKINVKTLSESFKHITSVFDEEEITVEATEIIETLRTLKDDYGYGLLLDVTAVDYLKYTVPQPDRFEVVYRLRNLDTYNTVKIKASVQDPELGVESATELFDSANWAERETFDQYGINFKGHPNLKRILNHHQFVGHPLRKDYNVRNRQICYAPDSMETDIKNRLKAKGISPEIDSLGTEHMYLNLGPSHPATHGAIRILTALDGETISACVLETGYLHRGFEKTVETKTYNQVVPYTDRLNYCSAISNNIGYAKTIEKMLGIDITPRCTTMRVILMELSRVIDHLVCNAANLVDMGGLTNYWYLYNQREFVYDILSKLTGARLTNSFTRIGGMYHDFYDGFETDLEDVLKKVEAGVNDSLSLVGKNRIVHDRTKGVCAITAADAISYGFTGPCLRATGVAYDQRADNPYYGYEDYKFDVIVGSEGDIYDRLMVRYEEIFQSISIIRQALKKLPSGPVTTDGAKWKLPEKRGVYTNIEELMNHFKLVFEGIQVPAGNCYDSTESPNGELGFFVVSDNSGRPYKVKVRPPCFPILSAFPHMTENQMVADAIINLGSLNIIAGELDR